MCFVPDDDLIAVETYGVCVNRNEGRKFLRYCHISGVLLLIITGFELKLLTILYNYNEL
jgi:hypothetical protein